MDAKEFLYNEIQSIDANIKELQNNINSLDKVLIEYKAAFENRASIDEHMYKELHRMNDILAENTESLKVHIRRTELLEQAVMKMDQKITDIEIKQIKDEAVSAWIKDKMIVGGKVLAGLSAVVGALIALKEYLLK